MKNLLYVGNHLQNSRSNLSYNAILGPLLQQSGYQVRYTSNKSNKVLRLLEMVWTTFSCRNTMDYVLIDTYSTQNFYYAILVSQLCRLCKLSYMPILHGGNLPNRLENSPQLSKLLFKYAHTNIAPSLYLKTRYKDFGYENVVYIPNTIPLKHYPYHIKTFDTPKLLWVRSFSEIYNPKLAIKVLHELQKRGYDASLCMVGPDTDGSLAKVKSLAKLLNISVDFFGKLNKTEWIELSQKSNVFINTTKIDNTPLTIIEAMALGLPVVSTNVGGMPYLVENGSDGVLVPSDDEVAMAGAIEVLFKNPFQTARMTIKAREKVEYFDWVKVEKIWHEVLKTSNVARSRS